MASQYSEEQDKTIYKVVVNEEEQYSIWPDYMKNPRGWRDVGKVGLKVECLAYIKEVWTDMRPLSLRKKMEELARNPPVARAIPQTPKIASLVDRLAIGNHPAVVCLRPEPSLRLFKDTLDSGYLRVKFTDTNPGTELGMQLNKDACNFEEANFEKGTGSIHVVGDSSLDFTRVRCVADINLDSLAGHGHLEKAEAEAAVA